MSVRSVLDLLWTGRLAGETWSTPAIVAGASGQPGCVIVADRSGRVQALGGLAGQSLWQYDADAVITASPVIAGVGDAPPLALIGAHDGRLVALDAASGRLLWQRALGRCVRATAAVTDGDADGRLAVLVPVYGNWLVCLDAATGEPNWRAYLPKEELRRAVGVVSSPLVADVNADGRLEVVVGTRAKRVYCLAEATGRLVWFRSFAYDVDSTPSFAIVDGQPLVFVGGGEHLNGLGDNSLHALRGSDGATVWRARVGGGLDSSPIIADLDGDGRLAVVVTSLADASCYAFDAATGVIRWRYRFGPTATCQHDAQNVCRPRATGVYITEHACCRSYTTPLVADVNADGRLEVVVGSNNGALVVLDGPSGAVVWRADTGGAVRGSPVLGDVDGDGWAELCVPSGDRLLVYRTAARGAAWPMFKGEPTHHGWLQPRAAAITTALPRPRAVWPRLLWRWLVVDSLLYLVTRVEKRLLRPLGVRLLAYY
jgi:outer membrane protein assembly factor BamB